MAASALDSQLVALADTLDMTRDKVPEKLQCAAKYCTKFLVNGYKGICCDSSVCESCFLKSQNSCPRCELSPYDLESERCKPNIAARKTAKEWLKKLSKVRAAETEQVKSPGVDSTPVDRPGLNDAPSIDGTFDLATAGSEPAALPTGDDVELPDARNQESAPAAENDEDGAEPHSDPTDVDAGDDEVEIQVEPSQEDEQYMDHSMIDTEEQEDQSAKDSQQVLESPSRPSSAEKQQFFSNSNGFDTNSNQGMNTADFNHMMQMMQNGGMGFNPMMGMQMGMNPMANMFGGFGGSNGGMNGMGGMNMGMNFNPNMFGAFQNNMWQNSNQNAFSGMGNDFNQSFNPNQQQNYPNGDFQSGFYARGYGRGRGGRGRGGFRGGRGNFQFQSQNQNQNRFNNFPNANEQQQQYDFQNAHSQMNHNRRVSRPEPVVLPQEEEMHADDDEFAPGGQEEVQEALGDDYIKKDTVVARNTDVNAPIATDDISTREPEMLQNDIVVIEQNGVADHSEKPGSYARSPEHENRGEDQKPIAEAYEEDLDMVMPPPTAPSGPSGRFGEKDYGFRARGHGRFSRSRGSIHLTNGHPASPVRSSSTNNVSRPDSAGGGGVVGAPTGPRAMRDPPSKPARQSSQSGGFQIMGRASMASSRLTEREGSPSPNGYDDYKPSDRFTSRQFSQREDRDNGRLENEQEPDDRDSRRRKSKRDPSGDYDMQEADNSYSRTSSHDRHKSHRSRRDRDSEKYGTESKHSSRRYREETANGDHDMNDYGEAIAGTDEKPRSHRKHRDEKYSKERDRDRDRDRDRERKREEPRDRDRKRSRHDRDYEEEDYDDRRHRSSKHHKKDHAKESETNGGRSSSHRSSQVPTPVATPTAKEAEKDPYTLEREARQRERMLKEDQRREKAANAKAGGGGSGRRVSYKTEEDAQRTMEQREMEIRAGRRR